MVQILLVIFPIPVVGRKFLSDSFFYIYLAIATLFKRLLCGYFLFHYNLNHFIYLVTAIIYFQQYHLVTLNMVYVMSEEQIKKNVWQKVISTELPVSLEVSR